MRKTRGTGIYLYEICESPALVSIPDFSETAEEIIASLRIQLKNNKCKKVAEYRNDFTLYEAGDKFLNARTNEYQDCYFLLDNTLSDIAYFTLYEFLTVPELGKCFTQSAVYQLPEYSNKLRGAARDLMLNRYLNITGLLISDNRQTKNGKEFWRKLLLDAFNRNLDVYIWHPGESPRVLQEDEMEYFDDTYAEPLPDGSYWQGRETKYRFIISK